MMATLMVRTIVLAGSLLMSACCGAVAQQATDDQYADLQKNFAKAYNRKDSMPWLRRSLRMPLE